MNLHIFNPEHDMVMAYGKQNITLPHSIQEFKKNLEYLPAFWAEDGDCVLTEDVAFSIKALKKAGKPHADVLFVKKESFNDLIFTKIEPWGWDAGVCDMLKKSGIDIGLLPSRQRLDDIKALSGRAQVAEALKYIRSGIESETCGESFFIGDISDIMYFIKTYGEIVIKAPWSSSGRGLRYLSESRYGDVSLQGWIRNTISSQGGVTVEPYYKKVKDFALEFYSDGKGGIEYLGISVFLTSDGSYYGNLITTDERKEEAITKFVSKEILDEIREHTISYFSSLFKDRYEGPFGTDMMIVAKNEGNGFLVNPCVEINVRRTMGHVANSILHDGKTPDEIMRIQHDVNYTLKFDKAESGFIKVL